MFANIPQELKELKQFVCWKSENIGAKKSTKVPYNALTGRPANVIDPTTWCSFVDACANAPAYSGIGFVFSDNDPFTFIDLDDSQGDEAAFARQIYIAKEFDSYSEISPSGKGLHIIIRGTVPNGRRRSFVEIYSSQRYATMTGNVYNNKPIIDCQDKLTQLWEQMGGETPQTIAIKGDDKETYCDAEVIEQASNASNANKFTKLYNGYWQDIYQSQSEADFALVDIIAFYTKNRAQIARLFRCSKLGNRSKALRKAYVDAMINRSFDHTLPKVDIDGFRNVVEDKIAADKLNNPQIVNVNTAGSFNGMTSPFDDDNVGSSPTPVAKSISMPPGLLGEIAAFIYASAPRPVPEIALAGAIGLMAGICGRAYNVSDQGMNFYILLIADTGSGKEHVASGISKLINQVVKQVPTANEFIGPAEIASGQALIKYINKNPCFVSILGEFGIRLGAMTDERASPVDKVMKRVIMDLYHKSGHGTPFNSSIYSDKDKNVAVTEWPAFSILGESTPETFYGCLNEDVITAGLLPRFMVIEYKGRRQYINESRLKEPNLNLVNKVAELTAMCQQIMHSKRVVNVIIDEESKELLNRFEIHTTDIMNETSRGFIKHLWNRAHIKVMKLAGLIAIGINPINPLIQADYVKWALDLVQADIKSLSLKFEVGDIGNNTAEGKQISELIKAIKEYLIRPYEELAKYGINQNLHDKRLVSYGYLSKRLIGMAAFRHDKFGATNALKRTIQTMIDSDKLREIGRSDLTKYGTTQKCYMVSDVKVLG